MIRIEFETNNAAFTESPGEESAAYLEYIVEGIRDGEFFPGETLKLFDSNGNRIGQATWEE